MVIQITAPGKVILHGEHSVVYGKLAIASSLDLRTTLYLYNKSSADTTLDVDFSSIGLKASIPIAKLLSTVLDNGQLPANSKTKYNFAKPADLPYDVIVDRIKGFINDETDYSTDIPKRNALIAFLYLYVGMIVPSGISLGGFSVEIWSDITIGAGMGSSASFAVCIAAGFMTYRKYKLSNEANVDIKCYSPEEKLLISDWALQAERVMHGNPSGIDNNVCTFGSIVKYRKGEPAKPLNLKYTLRGLLIDTDVPKSTKAQVEKVAQLKNMLPAVVEPILESMDAVSESAVDCLSRLDSVTSPACSSEEYTILNTLFDLNQNMLRTLGVSHPAIENICLILAKFKLHGKITGAGGGGYVLCLVPPDIGEDTLRLVKKELNDAGYETVQSLKLGCNGVQCSAAFDS